MAELDIKIFCSGLLDSTKKYMPEFEIITWERLHEDCRQLASKLESTSLKFQKMVTVARGGLIPAGVIASILNIRVIDTICMQSYDDSDYSKRELVVKKTSSFDGDGTGMLVIDDIIDSGTTIAKVKEFYPKSFIAALYVKLEGRARADVYVREINKWIVLPWEPLPEEYVTR
ncbi:MAG: xanthine phosphoribosyltransferase [Rickettsiales bacterium]|jgi:xanthine phosphoribosyltransferase|nr:xanthine phosphoribosyltransferase [Rickettsiales bacterium]